MTLSLREKILVYLLVLVLAVFCIYKFAYTSVAADYESNRTTYEDLSQQYELQEQQVARYADIDATLASAKEEASRAAEAFFPSLEPENLSLWLDGYIRRAGFTVGSITIADPAVATIGGVSSAASDYSYPIRDYAAAFLLPQDGAEETDMAQPDAGAPAAGQDKEAVPENSVLSTVVNLSLAGPAAAVDSFCDEIKNCGKTVMIRAMRYSPETGEDGGGEKFIVNITLVFYAVPKASDDVFR